MSETIEAPDKNWVDHLARAAHEYKLPGSWGGSSFRYHPCGFIRRGLMVVSEHHVDNHCTVYAATQPNTNWTRAKNHSCVSGDPKPTPKTGDMVKVYWSGRWSKNGPWQQVLMEVLHEVESEIEVAKKAREEEQEQLRAERQRKNEEYDRKLRERWEKQAMGE